MLKTDARQNVVSGWIASSEDDNTVIKVRLEFPSGIEEVEITRKKFNLVSRRADLGEADNITCRFTRNGDQITIRRIDLDV